MKKTEWYKSWYMIIIYCFVVFMIIIYFQDNFKFESDTEKIEEVPGLYQTINVGGLTFQLTEVEIYGTYNSVEDSVPDHYNMWWKIIVKNDGQYMEDVYNCGILLFEDGSQYKTTEYECEYIEMVPGASYLFLYNFYFSSMDFLDENLNTITFFSEQNRGLVKFAIDESEIAHTSNLEDF